MAGSMAIRAGPAYSQPATRGMVNMTIVGVVAAVGANVCDVDVIVLAPQVRNAVSPCGNPNTGEGVISNT